MYSINPQTVRERLYELSDPAEQERLWLSDGSHGRELSSFVEAVEMLYSDTGLSELLDRGRPTGLGAEVEAGLVKLDRLLRKVNGTEGPLVTINDPAMNEVRQLASELMQKLPAPG